MTKETLPENARRTQRLFRLDTDLREALNAFERSYFDFHLAKASGSMTVLALATGLERTHLYRKLAKLGIDRSVFRRR